MKTAEEILNSNLQIIADNYDMSQDEFNVVIKSMKIYANHKLEEAAGKAEKSHVNKQTGYHTKQSILSLKDEI